MSSRRRSAPMPPPSDRESAMGPPPVVPPSSSVHVDSASDKDLPMGPPPVPPSSSLLSRDSTDVSEKYRKLKRRYLELEQEHQEVTSELRRSSERNVKMRRERNVLLDRIMELESQTVAQTNGPAPSAVPVHQPQSSALPRSLLSARAQSSFASNLRMAVSEEDAEDNLDPPPSSHHRSSSSSLHLQSHLHPGDLPNREHPEQTHVRETRRSSSNSTRRSKQITGVSRNAPPQSFSPGPDTPPTLISSTGTRLRIKPPAVPDGPPHASNGVPPPPLPDSPSSSHTHSQAPSMSHSAMDARSQSTSSPDIPEDQRQQHQQLQQVYHGQGRAMSPSMGGGPGYGSSPYYRGQADERGLGGSTMTLPSLHRPTSANSTSPVIPPPRTPSAMAQQQRGSPPTSASAPGSGMTGSGHRHAKPKRLKAHTVTTKSYSIPTVPRDKNGRPMLPLNVGIMTVISLGQVCMREHFHTERYIFPVGYEVTRRYHSTIDPTAEVVYHCTILDGGDGPKFQIVPADTADQPVIAGTATGAWSAIVRKANAIRHRQHSNSVSGPDFFGLGQNTIKHLIQELPLADRLKDYVWQNFVEGGPLGGRHAAVIPALPEEYDATVAVGPYYPERRPPSLQPAPPNNNQEPSQQNHHHHHHNSNNGNHRQQHQHAQHAQIILPPPTTSETLTIEEYHPPPTQATDSGTRSRGGSPPPASPPYHIPHLDTVLQPHKIVTSNKSRGGSPPASPLYRYHHPDTVLPQPPMITDTRSRGGSPPPSSPQFRFRFHHPDTTLSHLPPLPARVSASLSRRRASTDDVVSPVSPTQRGQTTTANATAIGVPPTLAGILHAYPSSDTASPSTSTSGSAPGPGPALAPLSVGTRPASRGANGASSGASD